MFLKSGMTVANATMAPPNMSSKSASQRPENYQRPSLHHWNLIPRLVLIDTVAKVLNEIVKEKQYALNQASLSQLDLYTMQTCLEEKV